MGKTGHLPELFRQYGRPRQFSAGQQIFLKDSPANEIYYLERGKVRAYLLYPDGTERTLCFVERGNLVGEEVAARPPVRIVCADAVTDLLMYSMDAETLFRVCGEAVDCYPELLRLYMQKIELLSSWIFYAQFTRNDAKLACLLYSSTAGRNQVTYTQEQIAAVTGMSRVSVSKCLRDLTEKGLIRREYKKIWVLDRQGLRELFGEQEFY